MTMEFKILEIKNTKLTSTDESIIDFINENTEYFIKSNIQNIAKTSYVSTASISRFANKIGFNSFKKLQQYIYEKYKYKKKNYKLLTGDFLKDTINKIFTYNTCVINETIKNIDYNRLSLLINDIIINNRIFLFGVGSSWIACEELANNLQKIGLNIICNKDFYTQLLIIPSLTKNDQIILFSKSGKTKEIVEIIKDATQYNVPITLVTSNLNCGYEKYLHNKIIFKTLEQLSRYSTISSKIIQLLFIDVVFNQIIEKNKKYKILIQDGSKIIGNWNKFK